MSSTHESSHGMNHETEQGAGHSSAHETGTFMDSWWPLFVILFGFTCFLIIALWKPSY